MKIFTKLLLPVVLGVALTACVRPRPTMIAHVVLIKLDDPDKSQALIDDCDRLLPDIDGVVSYWSGTPDDSRTAPTIDHDWDVALCVGYPDDDAYAAYVVDPKHVELVDTWKPSIEWLRIHDVLLRHGVEEASTLRE